jgi:hypothetical protein
MWRSQTPVGVRCAHFPSVITTIMDHKVQLLKPLNKRELYATLKNHSRHKSSRLYSILYHIYESVPQTYHIIDCFKGSLYYATWYSTHTCSKLLMFNCENGVVNILYTIFTLNEANTCVALRTPDGVRCAHFPSVITTIKDPRLQLLKPLNKRELYTT